MPMRKHTSMVASRMKISMDVPMRSVERRDVVVVQQQIGWRSESDPLDDEKQQANAADRNRQIGDADREERKIRDRVVPGYLDQPLAPHDHEDRDQRHQQLNHQIEQLAEFVWQLIGGVGDVHVQVEPIRRGRPDEGQHDGQEHRHRFGPGCRAVEHVTREHRPGDDGRDQHQRHAADDDAHEIEIIHRPAKQCVNCYEIPDCLPQADATVRAPRRGVVRIQAMAWMRLIMSWYFGPYLSHTGLTAFWNGALSAISTISQPAALALSIAFCSYWFQSSRSSSWASRANFLSRA